MGLINFQTSYEDYILSKIHDKVENFSTYNIFLEADRKKFEDLIASVYPDTKVYEKTDFSYLKSVNNLEPFTLKCQVTDGFAVAYTVQNQNDESLEKKNFNYEEDSQWSVCNFSFYFDKANESKVKDIVDMLKSFIYVRNIKNRFYTIGIESGAFVLTPEKANKIDVNVAINYGSKFAAVHDEIFDALKTQHSGLILLHGEPGTGKTSYIRYLIAMLCQHKTIIYIPAYMVEQLANPEFMAFIQRYKESILILEDAEFVLQARNEEFGAQAVSNLLNITCGLLNDTTRLQVIATCNMDKKNIDKALLRPGRLLKEWRFDKLSIEDSIAVAKSLNKNQNITSPMTLAELYSGKTQTRKYKKRIGIKEENKEDEPKDNE